MEIINKKEKCKCDLLKEDIHELTEDWYKWALKEDNSTWADAADELLELLERYEK